MTKKLLALNFSGRKTGNCSIVMQEIIRPCKDQGLSIDLVNVALLKVRSCVGCFGCNNGELRCTMNDDLETIKEKIAWADAILIVTPSYTFSAPGIMKNIMDRSAAWAFEKIEEDQKSRIGISISIGGAPEQWNALQRVFPGLFLKLFNCEVLHQSVYRGIGLKGEVLLHHDILNQMHVVGTGLVKALKGEKNSFPENPEDQSRLVCPLCKADVFQVRLDGDYICATCGTEIKRSGLLKKHLSVGTFNLFTPQAARIHSDYVGGKILNGMEAAEEINNRSRQYFEQDILPQAKYVPKEGTTDQKEIAWDVEAAIEFEKVVPKMFRTFVKKAVAKKAAAAGYEIVTKEIS